MRKAVWGVLSLALFALTLGHPIRNTPGVHSVLALSGLAGYLLLSYFPPSADPRLRKFLIAGALAGLASFILVITSQGTPIPPILVLARVLGVASVALPLWLVARPPQFAFVAAGAIALFTIVDAVEKAGPYAMSVHAYVACAGALWVAWLVENPTPAAGQRSQKPRIVVAYDVQRLTEEEKAERIAALEKRFRAGELEEHKYWDKRQEIESR